MCSGPLRAGFTVCYLKHSSIFALRVHTYKQVMCNGKAAGSRSALMVHYTFHRQRYAEAQLET